MKKAISRIAALLIMVALVFGVLYVTNIAHLEINVGTSADKVKVEYGSEYKIPEAKAYYSSLFTPHGKDAEVTCEGSVDTSKLGTYEIKYTASEGIQTSEKVLKVEVVDTVAPVIKLKTGDTIYTSPAKEYKEDGYTATDNYDGDITDKVVRTATHDRVTYTVKDSSGNETTVTRDIIYKDVFKPSISIVGDTEAVLVVGESYKEKGAKATDDVDGDLTGKVQISGSVDTSKNGVYKIHYSVTDTAGNTANATRTVYVVKKNSPSTSSGNKIIYLTFDDGPGKYTQKLLTILAKYNVKATFFVTNQFSGYQNMIKKEAAQGHTVAVHSYSHNYSTIYKSADAFHKDIEKMNDIIEKQTGKRATILRFPGGTGNTVSRKYCKGVMSTLTKSVGAWGYYYCDWNVVSGDAGDTTSTSKIVSNVKNGCKKHNVSIVLQHDIKGYSVDAVEEIIKWGLANGYTFLPLSESSPFIHTKAAN